MSTILAGTHHRYVTVGETSYWGPENDFSLYVLGSILAAWPKDPNGFAILTDIHTGRVTIEAEGHPSAPPLDGELWEDIEVMIYETTSSSLLVCTAMGDGEESENLVDAPGRYVVRCAARGRDAYRRSQEDLWVSPECYRLDVWPATGEDENTILQARSTFGREMLNHPRWPRLQARRPETSNPEREAQ